jgi:uncharacterized repeat protein (TIGR03803 family)
MPLLLAVLAASLLALAWSASAGAIRNLTGFTSNVYGRNDDGSYPCVSLDDAVPPDCTPTPISIGFAINFYGNQFTQLYLNNNGNVTFDEPLAEFTPFTLTGVTNEIVAPFFADVDTRLGNTVTFGNDTVNGHPAFGVNWFNVGYYDEETNKLDSFQLVLIARPDRNPGDFDIEFNYGQVQWETGDASDGVNGLGGESAVVGFSNGSGLPGTYFQLQGSAQPGELLDRNPGGLIHNSLNTNVPGRYVFPIVNLTNTALNALRYSQHDPRWAATTYDHTSLMISNQGCALCSLAMALQYAGASTTPATLNTTLNSHGDFAGTSLGWDAATRDASGGSLVFHAYRTTSSSYLAQCLAAGFPVVVGVNLDTNGIPGHFVIVTGYQNGAYTIADPGYADQTTLAAFSNQFETRGYVAGQSGDKSGLTVTTSGSATFLLVDPTGRRTGFSPIVGAIQEIPQSTFFTDNVELDDFSALPGTNQVHQAIVPQALLGAYQLFVFGNQSGAYSLGGSYYTTTGSSVAPVSFQGVTTSGTAAQFLLTVASNRLTLTPLTNSSTLTTLQSFSGGDDGGNPYGGLIQASDGNLYGTTAKGGAYGFGTLFRITTNGLFTSLYSFGTEQDQYGDPIDGIYPYGALLQGADGSLYGTTVDGGDNGYGNVFQYTLDGTLNSIYSFGSVQDQDGDPLDGAYPYCTLIQSADGSLYGTTQAGGANGYNTDSGLGFGTLFQLTTNGSLTTLYSFGAVTSAEGTPSDGASPYGGLVLLSNGALEGATSSGGTNNDGVLFRFANGTLSVLYSFTGTNDGANPYAGLLLAADGSLYGSAVDAGTNNSGALFRLSTNGVFSALHSFAYVPDGADPHANLIQGADLNFYGSTSSGGGPGGGTIFRLSSTGALTTLYSFLDGPDGATPYGALLELGPTTFYGTTTAGGTNGQGTVFRLVTPPLTPAFQSVLRSNTTMNLVWGSVPGQTYQLQYSTNLSRTNWFNLGNPVTATNHTITASDPLTLRTNRARFYRIVALP